MNGDGLRKALCIGFGLAYWWPFVGLPDEGGAVFGVPFPLVYIFGGWAALVAVLRLLSGTSED